MPDEQNVEHPRMVNNVEHPTPPQGTGEGEADHNAVLHHGIFSGLSDHFKKHQAIWLVGIGGATLFVMILWWHNSQNQNNATAGGYPVGVPNPNTSPSDFGNAQGQYDPSMAPDWYSSLANSINQNTSVLGNIAQSLNQVQSPTPPPTSTTTGETPSNPPSQFAGLGASVGYQLPANTQIYAGSQGRWWFKVPGGTQKLLTGPHGSDLQTWLPDNQFQKIVAGANGRYWWEQGGVGALKPLVPTH